jgi:integrase
MRRLYAQLTSLRSHELSVLITGETGTGKELVAQAIHRSSVRSGGPLIVVDCTTIPSSLAESMLFGHEKGAFTGAVSRHVSPFLAAHGGTLFFDELGELPLDIQPKLLRALETRQIQSVGSNRPVPIDVRVVAATRRNLHAEMNSKQFREDLYYRFAQVVVDMPPLRARAEDIADLSVRTKRLVVTEGKTPVLEREEARQLFAALDAAALGGDILALRDRAMFAMMLFGFVRVGALVKMQVRDFEDESAIAYLVLHEKGGKERRIPCHHQTREYLRAYIALAGFEPRARVALFQSAPRRSRSLSGRGLTEGKVWDAVKRRCRAAGLPSSITNHSFRATGITIHQENKGRLEDAQALAGHADARTTRLYVRAERKVAQAEVERVQL